MLAVMRVYTAQQINTSVSVCRLLTSTPRKHFHGRYFYDLTLKCSEQTYCSQLSTRSDATKDTYFEVWVPGRTINGHVDFRRIGENSLTSLWSPPSNGELDDLHWQSKCDKFQRNPSHTPGRAGLPESRRRLIGQIGRAPACCCAVDWSPVAPGALSPL